MDVYSMYLWENREDVRLTAYITPKDPREPENSLRPAVIILPGGAYTSCTKHSGEGDGAALAFSSVGFQTFVLEYSVGTQARFPQPMIDYAATVKVIRDNAVEWNTDADRLSVLGFSAGGHLAGMIATAWHIMFNNEVVGLKPEHLKPVCAMLIYAVLDYKMQKEYSGSINSVSQMFINTFGTENPTEEQLIAFSPVRLVSEKTCPVFLAAAVDDSIVPSAQTIKMASALAEKKVPYELHMFENGDHMFATGLDREMPWRLDKKFAVSEWVLHAQKFLLRHVEPEVAAKDIRPIGKINHSKIRK